VTTAKHLTEEALLELAGQRLSGKDHRAAAEHLGTCDACRERYKKLHFAHRVFKRMAEVGLQEVLGEANKPSAQPQREVTFPWTPIVSIALTCICVIVFLLYPSAVTTVRASELLSNAMQHETSSGKATLFRVQVGEQICTEVQQNGLLISSETSSKCRHALQYIRRTPWNHGNPLSARTYALWRSSLPRHRDYIIKRETSWQIKTTTDEGPVRRASLEMRAADYHSTELKLGFEDNEEIRIFEYTIPLRKEPSTIVSLVERTSKNAFRDSPGDLLEVQAWKTLHKIGSDSGWDGIVVRKGASVSVYAIGAFDENKKRLSIGFGNLPEIRLEMHDIDAGGDSRGLLPPRKSVPISGAPLADTLLKRDFPDNDARTAYLNNEEMLSRAILGRAFLLDQLKIRQKALIHCSCAKDLASLVKQEERALIQDEVHFSTSLEPLIGRLPLSLSRPLKLEEAKGLDTSIQRLLKLPENCDESDLKSQIENVRRMLVLRPLVGKS
jgi:hypothetical protein